MVTTKFAASDEFAGLIRQMNQVVENALGRQFHGFSPTEAWHPSVNLYETADAFLICVDLGGMNRDEIDVHVDKKNVVIRGRRQCPMPPEGKPVAIHLMEIDHGSFCRAIEIPANVEAKHISAKYEQGFLWVSLPKKQSKKKSENVERGCAL